MREMYARCDPKKYRAPKDQRAALFSDPRKTCHKHKGRRDNHGVVCLPQAAQRRARRRRSAALQPVGFGVQQTGRLRPRPSRTLGHPHQIRHLTEGCRLCSHGHSHPGGATPRVCRDVAPLGSRSRTPRSLCQVKNQNIARDAGLSAGIPKNVPSHTVTQACISSN